MRKNKKSKPKSSSTLTLLIIFFILATVVLCFVLLFGWASGSKNNVNQSLDDNSQNPPNTKTRVNDGAQGGAADPKKTTNTSKAQNSSEELEASAEGKLQNKDTTPDEAGAAQKKAPTILCTEETQTYCLLPKESGLVGVLDIDPYKSGIMIDGQQVEVSNIRHRLVFRALGENTMGDSVGNVLVSSDTAYNIEGKTLTILIGTDRSYYLSLGSTEQKTLYVSQLVRSIFSVTGEIPSNFPKVARIVNSLVGWDPNN